MSDFKDYFSGQASQYAVFRPNSPDALFQFLLTLTPTRECAWDVGTGNGQAALKLSESFKKVFATDASEEQIRNAKPKENIQYKIAKAEDSQLPSGSVDLITAAQAVHWFKLEEFYKEVRRVSKPKAIIAFWTYTGQSVKSPSVDQTLKGFARGTLIKYWPTEIKYVFDQYKTLPFPFEEIPAPHFEIEEERNFMELAGLVYTWSGTQKAIKESGPEIFQDFVRDLEKVWGDPKQKLKISWPMALRIGRVVQPQ